MSVAVETALDRSRPRLRVGHALVLLVVVALAVTSVDLGATPARIVTALPEVASFAGDMWPPRFQPFGELVSAAWVTLEIAFVGTVLACLLSAPLAVLGARNLSPHPTVFAAVRFVVLVCRAVPDFVFALMFVAAVGLGPVPGVLALALHSVGMLGKLYAERIEEVDPGPLEAVEAMGASRLQAIRLAVLPQVMPSLVGNTLYRFDINIRSSIILGIVGAGGIGYELITAIQGLDFHRALAAIVVVLVLVAVVEAASNALRRRVA